MSAQELLDRLNEPTNWGRSWNQGVKRTKRAIKAKRRSTVSRLKLWYSQTYFFSRSIADIKKAARFNEDRVLGAGFIASVILIAVAALSSSILYAFFSTALNVVSAFDINTTIFVIATCAVFAICMAWMAGFLINSVVFSFWQGLNRTVYTTIITTLRTGLYFASRTVSAWLTLLIIISIPLVVLAGVALLALFNDLIDANMLLTSAPYLTIVSICWILYVISQYSLLPIVTMLEPEKSFYEALDRSRRLTIGRGRIFTFLAFIVFLLIGAGLFLLANQLDKLFGLSSFSLNIIFIGGLIVYWNVLMTVLYRKRRTALRRKPS